MTIYVTNQAEFDKAVINRNPNETIIVQSGNVVARGSSHVVARDSSHVEARDSSHVVARGSSHVVAWGSSHVVAGDSSHVEAWGSSHVVAWGSSHVEARGSGHVEARDSSHVEARGSSHVEARGSSHVEAWGSSHVEAWGSSHVVARGSSHVVAWGSSHVVAWDSSHVEIAGYAVAIKRNPDTPAIKNNGKHSIVVESFYQPPKDTKEWLSEEIVNAIRGFALVYKRVSSDFKTQEGTPNETDWSVGTFKEIKSWKPKEAECGEGKYHACSKPYFCDEFRNKDGDKYIAIKVKVTDLHFWGIGASYPHKVAFRKGKVMYECDRYGEKITKED